MPAPQRSTQGLRIGVFGGAFDPPHRAHRALAQAALNELRLDRLLLLPTGRAWHKARPLTEFRHRFAMCERAFGDLAGVSLDDREFRREGPTYTVDTLEELAHENPQAALFLVIGDDQLAAFTGWKRWHDVLRLARLVVADRPLARASDETPQRATNPTGDEAVSTRNPPFIRLYAPLPDISSTAVRALLGAGHTDPQALAELVPETVASYISQHSLYQKPS